MNHKCISFVAILAIATTIIADTEVTPTFVVRSQGIDGARKMAGLSDKVHLYDEGRYVNLAVTLEYAQSFRSTDIGRCLFGNDINCEQIIVQGSAVADRCDNAWLADNFYLAPDYNSTFKIRPRIQNIVADLDLFVGLDDMVEGMYMRIHGPLNYSRWDLRFEEACDIETTGSYNFGYFDSDIMFNNQLLGSFGEYARGDSPLNTNATGVNSLNIGVQFDGLDYAQIDGCSHSRTGFADLRFEVGGNLVKCDDAYLALNVQVAAPTGSRTKAQRAFDPVVGNRNHWEVGAGLYGRYDFYHSEDGDKNASLLFDLSLTHMNKANEERTFDLCGKQNSRYMLAMKMGRPVNYLRAGVAAANLPVPIAQFQSRFTPVANLTTLKIPVSIALQADFVAMLNCQYKKYSFDVGYNLYARTCENFGRPQELSQCCPSLCDGSRDMWALKGDAHVFGFADGNTPFTSDVPVPLSGTQCGATIHKGTNAGFTGDTCSVGDSELRNCGVDNPVSASASDGSEHVNLVHTPGLNDTPGDRIQTSLEPLFINCCDINLQRTRGISHKIFGNLSYTWEKNSYTPYIGVGGFAEFGRVADCDVCTPEVSCDQQCDNSSCDQFCCTKCLDCTMSQWGVWLKGGVSFE